MHFTSEQRERIKSWVQRVTPDIDIFWPGDGRVHPEETFTWDGKRTLVSHVVEGSQNCDFNALHDVAHHLVALPRHRKKPNWGLGPDPYESLEVQELSKPAMPEADIELCETMAIHLQFLLANVLGASIEELDGETAGNGITNLPDALDVRELKVYLGPALTPELWAEVEVAANRFTDYEAEGCS